MGIFTEYRGDDTGYFKIAVRKNSAMFMKIRTARWVLVSDR